MANATKPTDPATPPIPRFGAYPDAAERLRKMAEEQGVADKATVEFLRGDGSDLWESDEEFEQFLRYLRESRQRG